MSKYTSMLKNTIPSLSFLFAFLLIASCEQDRLEPALETADGGGTLTRFTAYTIDSTDPEGSNVNGRIVFWQDRSNRTLVQISVYNTVPGLQHPALILDGAVGMDNEIILDLGSVSGDTGELASSKFFIVDDADYYSSIAEMDSHINIYLSESDDIIVATGDLGSNAEPVDTN